MIAFTVDLYNIYIILKVTHNILKYNLQWVFLLADLTVSKRPGTSYQIETILLLLITYIFCFPL